MEHAEVAHGHAEEHPPTTVRGYVITPSYYLGQDLADLWLAR